MTVLVNNAGFDFDLIDLRRPVRQTGDGSGKYTRFRMSGKGFTLEIYLSTAQFTLVNTDVNI